METALINNLTALSSFDLARKMVALGEDEASDHEYDRLYEILRKRIGTGNADKLIDRQTRELETKAATPTPKITATVSADANGNKSDWLPFPEMNHEKYPDLPGFFVDRYDRLKEPANGKGRSGKVLSVHRCWQKRPDGSSFLAWGYRVRVSAKGRRKLIPRYYVAMARIRAEQNRRRGYRGD